MGAFHHKHLDPARLLKLRREGSRTVSYWLRKIEREIEEQRLAGITAATRGTRG